MGLLVDGKWHDVWYDTKASKGRFVRSESQFRNWVTPDGSPGPSGRGGFRAEPGRYHLYVGFACPWAHRTLIMRKLKGLEALIGVSAVNCFMGAEGWTFAPGPETIPDSVNHVAKLYELYTLGGREVLGPRDDSDSLGQARAHDRVERVGGDRPHAEHARSTASARIDNDYYPAELRGEIDELNAFIYPNVNNGVYRAGFATTQEAYEEAATAVFAALDKLEGRLATRRYLTGPRFTEADMRLFTTLIRFDPVYHGHFKCNVRRIVDYPNLWGFLRDVYHTPGIAETVHIDFIKRHYYGSHANLNPSRIVPIGPDLNYETPHGRERLVH